MRENMGVSRRRDGAQLADKIAGILAGIMDHFGAIESIKSIR